jgi:hypothetical protein
MVDNKHSSNSNSNNIKNVVIDPSLSFENLDYNVEKNKNSITQEIDINLDSFEDEMDSLDLNNNQNYNHKSVVLDNSLDAEDSIIESNENTEGKEEEVIDSKQKKTNSKRGGGESNIVEDSKDSEESEELIELNIDNIQSGGEVSKDDYTTYLEDKLKYLNPLVSKTAVKNNVTKYINNYYSNKLNTYYEELTKIYQKNIKKYYFMKKDRHLILYDKKTNHILNKVEVLEVVNSHNKIENLQNTTRSLKADLISQFIFIKKNPQLKETLEPTFNKIKNNYKKTLELLSSYQIYDDIINKLVNNLPLLLESNTTELYASIPSYNISADYEYNEKDFLNIPNDIIDDIYKNNNGQLELYNKIISSKSDVDNKSLIKEYLENKKNNKLTKKIAIIKQHQTVNFAIETI